MQISTIVSPFMTAVFLTLVPGVFGAPMSGRAREIAAVETRLAKLQNIAMSFHMDVNFASTPVLLAAMRRMAKLAEKHYPGGVPGPPFMGNYRFHCLFSFLAGRSWYQQVAVGLTRKAVTWVGAPEVTQSRMPGRVEVLSDSKLGEIYVRSGPLLDFMSCTSAIGLRPASFRHWLWIKRRQIVDMAYVRISGNRFALTQKTTAGGFAKYYRWIFRSKPVLEIVGLDVYHQPDVRHLYMRVTFSKFRMVGGLALPGRIKDTFLGGSRLPVPTRTELLTHIRYTLHAVSNIPRSYFIVWPKGCTVIDERTGSRFQIKSPTILSDKEIFRRLKRRDAVKAH